MKSAKNDVLWRVYVVYFFIVALGFAIIGKALYIQHFEGKELEEQAKQQEIKLVDVEAMRGNICAEDGTLLATSIPNFEVRMDVSTTNISDEFFKQNVDSLAISLAELFRDKKMSEYQSLLWDARRNGERYTLIHRDVTYPQLKQMQRFPIFKLGQYRGGIIVIPHYKRELPFKNLAKRTIGYESESEPNKIYVGLEGSFSKNLQGINGKRLMRRVGSSTWVPIDVENQVEPQNGDDIITTLDINLQDLSENALMKELTQDSADHGCLIVMEVKTGYIKALVNLGRTGKNNYEEIFNYAIGEASEPGSTFKLASFLVGLEDGKINLDQPVNTGNGVVLYSGRRMTDHDKGYGTITARQAFEFSSNVGTSKLIYNAYSSEPQKYIDGLYRMGLNKKLDLQIGGEGNPYIKSTQAKSWSAVSLPWISVGYEIKLTPMQLLSLYNAVANNGKMVRPIFVKEIRKNGQVEQTFPTDVINPAICSPSTIVKAKELLEGVVENGTATIIKNPVYKIAGKTGTAQLAQNNRGYKVGAKAHYKGSFTGYFPADNPRYSIFVMIYRPLRGKYYGSQVAAPVFKEIADQIFAKLKDINNSPPKDTSGLNIPYASGGMQKELNALYSMLNISVKPVDPDAQWARVLPSLTDVTLMPDKVSVNAMPDVIGMSLKDAVFLLEEMGMKVKINGKGAIVKQSVQPGEPYSKGTVVILDLLPVKV